MLAVKFLHLTSVNASEKTFICNYVFVMSHLQSEEEKNEPYTCKGKFIKLNFNLITKVYIRHAKTVDNKSLK